MSALFKSLAYALRFIPQIPISKDVMKQQMFYINRANKRIAGKPCDSIRDVCRGCYFDTDYQKQSCRVTSIPCTCGQRPEDLN